MASLNPTREFPVDGAAGEGFINTGSAQSMSPSFVTKYLDAAKEVASHAVLTPDGIAFSEFTSRRDWTDERVAKIRQFYDRYTVSKDVYVEVGGTGRIANRGGAIPLTRYLAATLEEREALRTILTPIRTAVKASGCNRAILVGHNAHFDLTFVNAAVERTGIKRNPFHPFSTFDTVSLAGLAFGQTVLARAVKSAGLDWDVNEAHSAIYDAETTAALFCQIVNCFAFVQP